MVAIARDAARRCALWHAVQRVAEACRASDRPFVEWPFADWSGYSFASGHTIGTTLLYGQLLLFVLPLLKVRHLRLLCIFGAASLVLLVGFTRIALGAHFLTDVLAAIFFGIIWLMLCAVLGKSVQRRTVAPAVSGSHRPDLER
jgi:membrane-associated phospholipid phosphatase